MGGATWNSQRVVIRHEHIPVQLLQPPARLKAVALDLANKGRRVGYIPGAGDRVAESLEEMGYEVTRLTGADLTSETLKDLDCVVIGVRAYNVRDDLAAHIWMRFSPMSRGEGRSSPSTTGRTGSETTGSPVRSCASLDARVTDENAPVTFLAPDHAVLTTPNKITQADMDGWVQERGIYFPTRWDAALHADPRVGRFGRDAAQGGPSCGEAWPGPLRLHGARVLPTASRRRPRGVPTLRQPGLARQMTLHDDASPGPPTTTRRCGGAGGRLDRPAVAAHLAGGLHRS